MATLTSPFLFFSSLLSLSLLTITAQAQVPKANQFKWVNQGQMSETSSEFDALYREITIPGFSNPPFVLCFYNTNPNAHVFAIRMGPEREYIPRWVWDANRNDPVHENATLNFGRDGNLILADVDGRVVWQTNTANKGVAGVKLLPNGNLVLHDSKRRFLWQSFDYPTDTLLVGQSLRLATTKKLVSRTSDANGSDGPYSLVINRNGFNFYMNHSGTPLQYGSLGGRSDSQMESVILAWKTETVDAYAFILSLNYIANGSIFDDFPLVRLNYNSTYSVLRLGSDGNLKIFTYYNKLLFAPWIETFSYFSDVDYSYLYWDFGFDRAYALPSKCGGFGLCEEGMCIACPQPQGMLGWNKSCSPPKLPSLSCKAGTSIDYYKIDGAEHFLSRNVEGVGPMKIEECRAKCSKDCKCVGFFYLKDLSLCWAVFLSRNVEGVGPMKIEECRAKCSKDCKCVGFFYLKDLSLCWAVPVLGTISKVEDSSRLAYIKFSK